MAKSKTKTDDKQKQVRIGVYICHCGINIAATIDIAETVEFTKKLDGVVIVRDYKYMCSAPGQELLKKDIIEQKLERIVVASCTPAIHEQTFRDTCKQAGLNSYCMEMANIREQCAWIHGPDQATRKAKLLIAGAAARAALLQPLEENEIDVTKQALVIGGGIAGIQASLDIAEAGFKVFLVEKEPSIGGRMAQLDKTFPTLDCSACIFTPKMVDVMRNPNIELITYAEVIGVEGYVGNFKVKIKKKPRYIDTQKCVSCGLCAEACRLKDKVLSEFEEGMGKRSAVYIPFPQAVPALYTIDSQNCLFLQKGKCGKAPACEKACPADAVDFKQAEEIIEIDAGAIIVATGYDPFDARIKPEYGYHLYDEVITGLEFERLISSSGPTDGKILINDKEPKKVVFIQCVGSRDKQIGNEYCSRVCCMYTAKQAYLLREKIPDAEVTVFYIDVRAFGKGFEEFYDRVRESGVNYIRGNASEVYKKAGKLAVSAEDTLQGRPIEVEADLVVLATGLVARSDAGDIASLLRIPQGQDKFFSEAHPKLRPVDTSSDGIFLAGCCQGPKDIPDTVAQAKAAASSAIGLLSKRKITTAPITAVINTEKCADCRTCQNVCPYDVIYFDTDKKCMAVNKILCKGCGICAATCPASCISLNNYTDEQIFAQLKMLAGEEG